MARDECRRFRNRADAGARLADALADHHWHDPLVLAVPRGGVAVGAALAAGIGAELDAVLVRKLRHPLDAELAIGAVGEDGRLVLNPGATDSPAVTLEYLRWELDRQMVELHRRRQVVRRVRPPARVAGRSVVLTDDGIATGATVQAALTVVRTQSPREIVLAVPIASPDRLPALAGLCDRVVCLAAPADFRAVGDYYDDFGEVTDAAAVALLRAATRSDPAGSVRCRPRTAGAEAATSAGERFATSVG